MSKKKVSVTHSHKGECSCHEHEHKHENCCSCHEHEHENNHEEHCSCTCSHGHGHAHSHSCSCGSEHTIGSTKSELIKIIISIIAAGIGLFIISKGYTAVGIATIAAGYLLSSYEIFYDAFKGIIKGHFLDENFLMAIASLGAFILGEYIEALAVLILFKIGEMFEHYAEERSRRSINALESLKEESALLLKDGEERHVRIDEVKVGDIVYIYPGGRIAFDGVVASGDSSVDTSAITGESLPREITVGDEVYSGFINTNARIAIEVKKPASESTVSRILKLVESANEKKSSQESFIRRFAKVYTPTVVISALLIAIIPIFFGFTPSESIYRALSFLVVSCPCALVVSVPLAVFCGIGKASRFGVLIKGGSTIEALSKAKVAVFDKTGTLTEGKFIVSKIYSYIDENELLRLAASAESYSTHPIAVSIVEEAKQRNLTFYKADEVNELAGIGVSAKINGKTVTVGKSERNGILVTLDGEEIGNLLLEDKIKDGAKEALASLKENGIKECIILTGDGEENAKCVALAVGADSLKHGLLPENKSTALEEIKCRLTSKEKVIFTGDGINDAPVLALADVGISVGDFASDAAIEASDIVLLGAEKGSCDIAKISRALLLSKKTMRIMKTNIYLSIAIKLSVLLLSSFGLVGLWAAIFADVGVLILAILNSLRV